MFFGADSNDIFLIFQKRRNELLQVVKEANPNRNVGAILLFADFENNKTVFNQESSFYYLTGINDPAVALLIDFAGKVTLYIPHYAEREQWLNVPLEPTEKNAKKLGVEKLSFLGEQSAHYQMQPFFKKQEYGHLIEEIKKIITVGGSIFSLNPDNSYEYIEQRNILRHLSTFISDFMPAVVDISPFLAAMRRRKDMYEIEQLYKAIEITTLAHEAAAHAITQNISECEVQASLEYIYTASCVHSAYPTIVASGKNSCILHHQPSSSIMQNNDIVIIDSGAQYNHYCADITRTYPVSGTFTTRQKEVYNCVLETQEYIADIIKPGYWIYNEQEQEKSLHHLSVAFLKDRGYENYIVHRIGHFLGLDVHDVGNVREPLKEGDVITIEPGLYIPKEHIGIRIEDNYWITKKGAICLSEQLPKKAEEVEVMIQQSFSKEDDEEDIDIDLLDEFEN